MSKKQILLVGGGGHCKSCIDLLETLEEFQIEGIVDSQLEKGWDVGGYQVLGDDSCLNTLFPSVRTALISVGQIKSAIVRERLYLLLKEIGYSLPSVISPRAYVSTSCSIDDGNSFFSDVVINHSVSIGIGNIINTKALLEHDVTVGDFNHISTGAILNGNVKIGNGCLIGSGAVIIQDVSVCNNVIIGAGSVVFRDITKPGVYLGNPSKMLRGTDA